MNTNHILVAYIYLYKVELYNFENDGALAEIAYLLLLCLNQLFDGVPSGKQRQCGAILDSGVFFNHNRLYANTFIK